MFEQIEMLVAQNVEPVKAVIQSGSYAAGVYVGYFFAIAMFVFSLWFNFYYADKKGYTDNQQVKCFLLYTFSIIGAFFTLLYVLVQIVVNTPVRYLIGYAALRYLNLI